MNFKRKNKTEQTTLEKCLLVEVALSGRRPQTITQILKRLFLNPAVYAR
jgi:hypothetical protein